MPVVIEYNIDDTTAQAFFTYADRHISRMTEPMRRIANMVHAYTEMQFESEGLMMSGGWMPLTPKYEERKTQEVGPKPILERSGDMKEDVTREPLTGLGLMHESAGRVRYGNGWMTYDPEHWAGGDHPVELVQLHQEGRDFGTRGGFMPARPIWETTDEFEEAVQVAVADWLDDVRGGPGPARNPGFDFLPVVSA